MNLTPIEILAIRIEIRQQEIKKLWAGIKELEAPRRKRRSRAVIEGRQHTAKMMRQEIAKLSRELRSLYDCGEP